MAPDLEGLPGVVEPGAGDLPVAPEVLAEWPAGADTGIVRVERLSGVVNGGCYPVEDRAGLRREVGRGEPGRVIRRPREAPVIPCLRVGRAEGAEGVGLRRDVVLHLVVRDRRPAVAGGPSPRGVRERGVRRLQVRWRSRGRVRP